MTHTNAELAVNSINRLLSDKNLNEKSIELLSCATANADQLMPSHASMVHGLLKINLWRYFQPQEFVYLEFRH